MSKSNDRYPFQWPKPSILPYCALILLFINIGLTYFFTYIQVDIRWLLPFWALNILFFWAERIDYNRNKRLFDMWAAEMEMIFGDKNKNKKEQWEDGLASIKRTRVGRRKSRKSDIEKTDKVKIEQQANKSHINQ